MKKRLFIVFIFALGGVALWWFTRPTAEAPPPAKVVQSLATLKPAAPVLTPKPAQIEAPKVRPAAPKSVPTEAAAIDPRIDPHTAVADMLRLLDAGDYYTYMNVHMKPFIMDQIDQQQGLDKFIKMLQGQPGADRRLAHLKEALAAIKDATPVYKTYHFDTVPNEECAEFKLDPPISGKTVFSLEKVNGLWYSMDMLGWNGEDRMNVKPATLDDPDATRKIVEQADAKRKALQDGTPTQPRP